MRRTHSHTLKLSDIARDPVVKAFFRRGEDGQSPLDIVSLTPPLKPAPSAAELELA